MATSETTDNVESLDSFRERARKFIRANLPERTTQRERSLSMADAKALQAVIFEAGFAGIAVPAEYGGAGLTLAHQKVWAEEVEPYVVPTPLFVSMGMLGITLLDHGSETLKRRHIPGILRGDEVW